MADSRSVWLDEFFDDKQYLTSCSDESQPELQEPQTKIEEQWLGQFPAVSPRNLVLDPFFEYSVAPASDYFSEYLKSSPDYFFFQEPRKQKKPQKKQDKKLRMDLPRASEMEIKQNLLNFIRYCMAQNSCHESGCWHMYLRQQEQTDVDSKMRWKLQWGECKVVIYSPKVAQKSYGTEKRFLCPPPLISAMGNFFYPSSPFASSPFGSIPKTHNDIPGWLCPTPLKRLPQVSLKMREGDYNLLDRGECVNLNHAGWHTTVKRRKMDDLVSIDKYCGENICGNQPLERWTFKQLWISDSERKKSFECVFKFNQLPIEFSSKNIKVISKPSKKRMTASSSSAPIVGAVTSGTLVSLFNRIRSQTVSTKYLTVGASFFVPSTLVPQNQETTKLQGLTSLDATLFTENKVQHIFPGAVTPELVRFLSSTSSWTSFEIHLVDEFERTSPYMVLPEFLCSCDVCSLKEPKVIYYNQTIILQDPITGLRSRELVIRKVEKSTLAIVAEGKVGFEKVCRLYPLANHPWVLHSKNQEMHLAKLDPLSQLHKVAFQLKDSNYPGSFLSLVDNKIGVYSPDLTAVSFLSYDDKLKNSPETQGMLMVDITELAVWTIVGTEKQEHHFYVPRDISSLLFSYPVVLNIQIQQNILTIQGSHFCSVLDVYLADIKCKTEFLMESQIQVVLPSSQSILSFLFQSDGMENDVSLNQNYANFIHCPGRQTKNEKIIGLETNDPSLLLPILLVRHDGIIFNSSFLYLFKLEEKVLGNNIIVLN